MPDFDDIISSLNKRKVKSISDAAYSMGDFGLDTGVQYDVFTFDSLSADRALNLPTLADNQGYEFDVINLDGSYNVDLTPEGAELLNDWNSTFQITEKGGRVRVVGLSGKWLLIPLGDACIYEVSSETADTGLAVDGTWDDVSGMTLLNGIYGKGYLDSYAVQHGIDASYPQYMSMFWGIGKTSGDNAPDILGSTINKDMIYMSVADTLHQRRLIWQLNNFPYESDGSIIYMKAKVSSDETPYTSHTMYGDTNCPMYIRFVREY